MTEKDSVIECLIVDLSNSYDIQKLLKSELSELYSKVVDQQDNMSKIKSLKTELDAQIYANQVCIQEKVKSETWSLQLKKILESWCKSTKKG